MKSYLSFVVALTIISLLQARVCISQEEKNIEDEGYVFTVIKENPSTPAKNQFRSSTCWSFSTLGFMESELLRMGKDEYDLSEMFIVKHIYAEKARKYVRFQDKINFGGGGAFHDAMHVIKTYGIVPESVFSGKLPGEANHIHGELDEVALAYVDAVVKNRNRKLSPVWFEGFEGILDAYLGEYPVNFSYNGKDYTPMSFAAELGINPDDYVEIGSYSHHPYYEKFVLEVPDNWMQDPVYNVPLAEMMEIIENAIGNGYTVAWGSDISEKGFSWEKGVAIVPDEELKDLSGTEKEKWEKLTRRERENSLYGFNGPVKEKTITQELRQTEFDNYSTTDDHGMQIVGTATDQSGNRFYKVKNSWGSDDHIYKGYFYASKAFIELKTIDILVHKNSIPKNIQKKLGL